MSERTFSLDVIGVAAPCHEDWDAMHGDERQRFCDQCDKHVHNLSEMTRDQAEAFVNANPTGVCIRMVKDRDGRVVTTDHPRVARHGRRRMAAFTWMPWLGAVGGLASSALIWFGIMQKPMPIRTMGAMCPPPPSNQTPPPPAQQPNQPVPQQSVTQHGPGLITHMGGACPPPWLTAKPEQQEPPKLEPVEPPLMGIICPPKQDEPKPQLPHFSPEVFQTIERIKQNPQQELAPEYVVLLGRITPQQQQQIELPPDVIEAFQAQHDQIE